MKYSSLAEVYNVIESTSKRLAKTYHISELLKNTNPEDINSTILLLRGKIYPDWDKRKLGISGKIVAKAIKLASGKTGNEIDNLWREIGDLGLVTEKVIEKKSQATLFSENLSVKKVFSNLRKVNEMEGMGSVDRKIQMVAELLSSARPKEAKYIVRTVLGELRAGIGESTLRDALFYAYISKQTNYDEESNTLSQEIKPDQIKALQKIKKEYAEEISEINLAKEIIQSALNKSNDFATVAIAAQKGIEELIKIRLLAGKPIKVMLAQKVLSLKEGFERVGTPAELEYKYDGFRMQIHKHNENIRIFTRRLEDVTKQFPEVVAYVNNNIKGSEFIIDCEAVGYDSKTKKYLVFQNISQRIRRKYNIKELAQKLPVELNIFDILSFEGTTLIEKPFKERRELLEKIVKEEPFSIILAKSIVTGEEQEAKKFYEESVRKGNEGIMMKNINSFYKPGSRVGFMVKFKSSMDTMDLVIIGAEWGEGKRSGWLTSFKLACIDEDDQFQEMGKVGTGIKEKPEEGLSFEELTEMLRPLIKDQKGREVTIHPAVVLEIQFEEIQKSTHYSSGYALRFPRVKTLREDRDAEECTTLEMVEQEFNKQLKL